MAETTHSGGFVASALAFIVIVAAAPLQAQPKPASPNLAPEAREHLERGLRFFSTQDYAEAIDEFKSGYRIDPDPTFLYALGQAQRLSGNCKDAAQAYLSFLRANPPAAQAELARDNLAKCEAEIAREAPAPPSAAPTRGGAPTVDPTRREAPKPPSSRRSPFYTDVIGDGLVALGVVGVGLGAGLWITASSHASSANEATTIGEFENERQSRTAFVTGAAVAGGVGVLLLAGGILRWALVGSKPAAVGQALAAGSPPGAASKRGLRVIGRF